MSSLQERIQEAQTSHSLNLRKMGLSSLPDEILVLADSLQELLLTDNPLGVLPDWIGQFKKLKLLDVGDCQLKTLPAAILELRRHLEEITFKGNEGFSPSLDNLCAKVYWFPAGATADHWRFRRRRFRIDFAGRTWGYWIPGATETWVVDRAVWKRHTQELLQALYTVTKDPDAIFQSAFKAALSRGSVESHSLKVLFLGAVMAGKTALLAALQGEPLPEEKDRSVATRMKRVRLVLNCEGGFFEAVPLEEYRLASMIGTPRDATATDPRDDGGEEESLMSPTVVTPPPVPPVPTTAASSSTFVPNAPTLPTSPAPVALTMSAVQDLLIGELSEQHVDLDTFDFAGEPMFDSLPALFMGSESAYILVFDLSVMDDRTAAQRQYEHLSKWAHVIAHQVPETLSSYFRVLIVGTHVDTFPDDTAPQSLLRTVAKGIDRLVGPVLGNHLILPGSGRTPFFQVGSVKGIGLRELSEGMHAAVRRRTLPLEYVCAQDLVGRWSRMGRIELLSSVGDLPSVVLSETTPVITVGSLVPDEQALRTGLVPYLEEAADVLVCREDSSARGVAAVDTIVFDVPRLIAAVELLCSVVMAQWERATSERALDMLDLVKAAGRRLDNKKTLKLFRELDESRERSEEGFPVEVALWLVWTAAAREAKGEPVLAGADVRDGPALFSALKRLSLVFRHGSRLLVPMLLPEHAPFVERATPAPVQVMLYQVVKDEEDTRSVLPVSLATFHLVVVALWWETMKVCEIRATQRCTDLLVMDGCAPVRLRLNVGEECIRVEVCDDGGPAERVMATLQRVSTRVCERTQSLRWGWRGVAVLVPAHPSKPSLPLFRPLDVAASPEMYREEGTLAAVLHSEEPRVCNVKVEEWWTKRLCGPMSRRYVHAASLIVGVSRYESTSNPHLAAFADLPGVRRSVSALESLWKGRGFKVQSVTDTQAGDRVTAVEIAAAARRLIGDVGDGVGRDALLIVHLLGHGAEDSQGGLLLSDAERTVFAPNTFSPFSRFNLDALKGLLTATVQWPGCNILVVCDFCWSGALLKAEDDLSFSSTDAQHGYSRQLLASSLADTSSFMSQEQVNWTKADGTVVKTSKYTRLTELLLRALGPTTLSAFRTGEEHITAVGLRQRLREMDTAHTYQAMVVGRIWDEWLGTRNDGDILLFRDGK